MKLHGPGALSPLCKTRMGTHIAISRGADVMKILYPTPGKYSRMVSHHSGMTPMEMLVPLIVV